MNSCDVVIPTYNNPDVLNLTVSDLEEQYVPPGWQVRVVIVDDGSSAPIKKPAIKRNMTSMILRQQHAGAATARNRGVKESVADIILFLGDDILLRPGALAGHLEFHSRNKKEKSAALGMVRWDPRLRPTPFMEWMTHGGPQNNFDSLLGEKVASPKHFFFGSHVSAKRSLLQKSPFPTEYKGYGWEDLDVGCDLEAKGVELAILHQAIGLHRHSYTPEKIYRRQYAAGQGIATFKNRHKGKTTFPSLSRRASRKLVFYRMPGVRRVAQRVMGAIGQKKSAPRLFEGITTAEFWMGAKSSGKLYYK